MMVLWMARDSSPACSLRIFVVIPIATNSTLVAYVLCNLERAPALPLNTTFVTRSASAVSQLQWTSRLSAPKYWSSHTLGSASPFLHASAA